MHPLVQPTTRTPGPSTVDPVVNEWRKPMSPVASARRTSDSGTLLPWLTRSWYASFASSTGSFAATFSGMAISPVERPIDDIHLLFARQPHEIDRIARHADRQARVLLRVIHRVEQRVAIQHVDVHVIPGAAEKGVEHRGEVA